MKNTLFVLSVLFYAAISSTQDSWILVFHKNVTEERRNAHLGRVMTQVFANYTIGKDFRGYAAHFKKEEVARALATGDIDYAEPDQMMHASQACYSQNGATWGLNRISEKQIELDGSYIYSRDGSGVQAFIIDTGILISHNEFAGRATFGANYAGDGINNDCNGHGTHVAGTVGGSTYGVAKKVTLTAVKVLGCSGSGTNSGVISGVNYAATNGNKKPSVANMSLGGGYSKALNDAVAAAVKAGVVFVVAAGNDNADACNYSPASEPTAISVGSTDVADKGDPDVQEDIRSSFSNYGTCVSVFAPGSLITSAWYTSNTATRTISGTSMASPHIAGVAALYLGENPNETPANIEKFILNDATQNVIDLACSSTVCNRSPNLLAYSACS